MSGNPPTTNPAAGNQLAAGPTQANVPQQLGQVFTTVFYRCTQYSVAHCHVGNPLSDANVPATVKNRLVNVCDSQQQATALLQDPYTKTSVIAKLVCIFLESNVFKVELFRGFNNQHDQLVEGVQMDNYEHMPVPNRTVLLANVQASFRRLMHDPGFNQHVQTVVQNQGEAIWPTLQALFGHKTTADWADLRQMMEEAVMLSGSLFVNPARYIFTYFKPGDAFQDTEMQCLSPAFSHLTGPVLQQESFVVAFCVTPRVEMRLYAQAGYITTVTITKAAVLCNAPPVQQAAIGPPAPPAPAPPKDPRKMIGRRGYDGAESTSDEASE